MLYHQACGLAQEGMDVYAITRQDGVLSSPLIKNISGVEVACYGAPVNDILHFLISLLRNPSKLYNRFIKGKPIAAVITHQPATFLALWLKGKMRNMPIIYIFHSPWHDEYLLQHEKIPPVRKFLPVLFRQITEKICVRRSQKIMVLSKYMKKKVQRIHRAPGDKIIINPGGVDLNRFKPVQNRVTLKNELRLPEGKIHLLTIRNLEPRMGLDRLLMCILMLKKADIDVHLIIGGEGIERGKLENLVRESNLADNVKMTGFIPGDLLPRYYGAVDFFVLPTRRLEGFGLVTPESMACGTPVLGTPVGGTREILLNFDSEFLFKDASPEAMAEGIEMAIKKYFSDKKKYNELRFRCREYAEKNYSWQRHVDQLKSILKELVVVNRRNIGQVGQSTRPSTKR